MSSGAVGAGVGAEVGAIVGVVVGVEVGAAVGGPLQDMLSIFDCFKSIWTIADTDAILNLTRSTEFAIHVITRSYTKGGAGAGTTAVETGVTEVPVERVLILV
jgi:hypothetical protein